MRLGLRKIIAPLLLLVPSAAQAQLWGGPAAVEIRVEDQKGPPVAGATLTLRYNDVDPKDGPGAVLTDSHGKATVGGLAEGSWHLEVSHEGYMTYLAEITVREKGRIVLEEAAQFNVVGATRTMRVQISRGKAGPVPRPSVVAERVPEPAPVPSPPAAAAPPAPQPENPPAPAPPEETTATPAPVPAPPVPPAPPAPQPAPEPAPTPEPPVAKPVTAPAPTPAPPPAAAPTVQPPVNPPAPEPLLAKPKIPPAPPPIAPAPAPEPAVRPAPAPPVSQPSDPVRLRTAKDRTCFECPPGESALSTERIIQSGGGSGCGADIAAQLQTGTVPSGLPAGCHVLRVALPAGARYTGYRFEVQTGGDSLDCLAGQSCPQSTGRWPINPVLLRHPEGTVILAPFEAGPSERERRAVLTAYFTTGPARRPR